ncbi:superoxide dismutase, Ni [Sulfurimonas sp.]|mgnify:FL=1|jgi:nickel superoxide dismutase|uniref:superoxide dismutase, Ni n=1 Tax=Sulfurimonas sp. TaxID=2022749 RepID=UPI0025E19B59|nr:superoxide dismutase, Ni [Sulfurimonas sp.]MBT5934826.1 superoxide dismutase, Ni [Sulfurimonas sp.]
MFKLDEVKAHCDVPCGIYDTNRAIVAALSVVRMVDLINARMETEDAASAQGQNDIARYINTKEEEAAVCKEEIRIIWGDFIKPVHVLDNPDIHTMVHNIMMLGGAAKQHVSREKAMDLLAAVNDFSELFWKLKGMESKRVTAPYAPGEEMVLPVI